MFGGIRQYCLVRPAVVNEIGLTVAIEVGCSEPHGTGHRLLIEARGPRTIHWVRSTFLTEMPRTTYLYGSQRRIGHHSPTFAPADQGFSRIVGKNGAPSMHLTECG